MILVNFAHPLLPEHLNQLKVFAGAQVDRVIDRGVQVDVNEPIKSQVVALVDSVGLSPADWQTQPLLINPPSLSSIACAVLAELHGRCGYFPPMLRWRRVDGAMPPRYEVVEILNLQAVRDGARARRG